MIRIGEYCRLKAARTTDNGLYLTDGENEVLLPRKYVPEGTEIGHTVRVFVTTDSEDRPVATTQRPLGVVGDFAALKVKQLTPVGAFMDWGLDKDLLIPFAEQHRRMEEGEWMLVRIDRDERTNRVFGSTKLGKYLKPEASELRDRLEVDGIVAEQVSQGYRFIIEEMYFAMLFNDEVHGRLQIGEKRKVYIKRVREDGQLAISLTPQGYSAALDQGPVILERLKKAGGFLPYGDKSDPDEIRREFGLSKGTFKKAIGGLMKAGSIEVADYGIRLPAPKTPPKSPTERPPVNLPPPERGRR
jgi:predicted RNA-binding protein (virulence factor B family)